MSRHWYVRPRRVEPFDGISLTKQVLFYIGDVAWVCFIAAVLMTGLFLWAASKPVRAQHHHAQHHSHYQSWVNKDNKGCCNNQHCRTLADADERTRCLRIARLSLESNRPWLGRQKPVSALALLPAKAVVMIEAV